jgi:hypothetical protein
MMKRSSRRRLNALSKVCIVAAVIVLAGGIILSLTQHNENNQTTRHKPEAISGGTDPAPETTKSSDDEFKSHQVAPDAPRYIFIPKISVRAMVKPVGMTPGNQIASPRNVYDVGWFTGGAKPGQPGAMVVDGHISSWETRGVFYNLKDLRPEDHITIERGDGVVLTYEVVRSQIYDATSVDMAAALNPVTADKPGLNLISCTGKVIKNSNEFDKRIVVFSRQL